MSEIITQDVVVSNEEPRMEILSFAVAIPTDIVRGFDEPKLDGIAVGVPDSGIVGTIVLTKKSAIVWFGWGLHRAGASRTTPENAKLVGSASGLSMGPLMVAMPRTKYNGAMSNDGATSKLIGDNEDSEMIARQMASRLSQRLGRSILVSCNLTGAPSMFTEGVDETMIQQRAAALAEREIRRLLEEKEVAPG